MKLFSLRSIRRGPFDQPSLSPGLCVTLISVLTLASFTGGSTAKAMLPLVHPAPTLKNVRVALPYSYDEVSRKNISGLDLEAPALKEKTLDQAREYIEYRRGRMNSGKAQAWRNACEASADSTLETPFCRYEMDRTSTGKPKSRTANRSERSRLADELRNGQYEKAAAVDFTGVVRAIGQIGSSDELISYGRKLAKSENCVPSNLTSALGYKLEEEFPDAEVVEITKSLYRRAGKCGQNLASAQASFRLGLILIWQHQCTEVNELMSRTESVSEASTFHSRAKFWRHYCSEKLGNNDGRLAAKQSLLKDHPFTFQNLAVNGADQAALTTIIRNDAPMVAVRSMIRPELNPLIRAAEALAAQGAPELAAEIFDKKSREIEGLEPEVRMYAAVFLNRIGFALPKFKILSNLFQDAPKMISAATLKMFFPIWYLDVVRAKQDRIDPLLILSLIRQESAFNKDARSIVGARGLMQVMPATARMVASVRVKALSDPAINIDIGSKYLAQRLNQYDGDVELTLAAYNAGFGRVDQWRKRYPTDNKMLFLDLIPFRETRDYVSSILRNYYFYVSLYGTDANLLADQDMAASAAMEGVKIAKPSEPLGINSPAFAKVQAILNANAGAVAGMKR